MRVLALGGGGYIGSHLCKRLLEGGHTVAVLDTDFEKFDVVLGERGSSAHRINQDLRDVSEVALAELCREADVVIDLIAHATPALYNKQPLEVVQLNLFENLRVVEACRAVGTRLVQFSSCEVYGLAQYAEDVFSEDTSKLTVGPICESRWIYSCAKQLLERMVHAEGEQRGLEWSIIRPFNFIGPEMDYLTTDFDDKVPRVFPQFVSSLLHGRPLRLVDGGGAHRTFTYIDDAIDGCLLVVENQDQRFSQEIVNVGAKGNGATIAELAGLMCAIYTELADKPSPDIVTVSSEDFYGKGYADCNVRVPDITKLAAAGWEPKYSLPEAIDKTLRYYLFSPDQR